MDEDWLARWRDGRIGFHEGRPNDFLVHHGARLAGRVFVPLCGKSEDLAYLAAHGHAVVGVELADQAVEAFFAEHELSPIRTRHGPLTEYHAGSITIFAGDLFSATPALLGPLDALYDRAALIALPPELRAPYVRHLRSVLRPGATGLVITTEYDPTRMTGPPFSVFEPEVRAHYAGATVELLEERPAPRNGTCAQRGVSATERCFAVRLDEPT